MTTSDNSNPTDGYTKLLDLWNVARNLPGNDENSLANLVYGFWHAGNTLDTFMDYYGRAKPEGYQRDAANRSEEAITVFKDAIGVDPTNPPPPEPPGQAWWDDYGWWGVALLKAYRLTNGSKYLQGAKTCWDFMEKGGRHFSPGKHEEGGTWNHDPVQGGVQNLITNSLFLNLSSQLYGFTKEQQYLDGACAQFQWFYHWFIKGALCTVEPAGKLVYPSCGVAVSVNDDSIQNNKNTYWTGDQGAVMGALGELLRIAADAAPKIKGPSDLTSYLKDACNWIASAVMTNKYMVYQNTGVLWEPQWYDLNGAVGKGALMRYLGAWLQSQGTVSGAKKFIGDNASAATGSTKPGDCFPFAWAPNDPNNKIDAPDSDKTLKELTRQTAGQDAYNAYLLVSA